MKIGIASDHAGFELKEDLKAFLESLGHEVEDFGAHELDSNDDYPDFIIPAAKGVADGSVERAIVIGSSGQGEAMVANRIKGVRASVYYGDVTAKNDSQKLSTPAGQVIDSREGNDANVLSLGASYVDEEEARDVVLKWLNTEFAKEERHVRRIKKIDEPT